VHDLEGKEGDINNDIHFFPRNLVTIWDEWART
jgi:hypothetical protein